MKKWPVVCRAEYHLGAIIQFPSGRGEGVVGVCAADNSSISNRLGDALIFLIFIICLYRTFLKVNYLLHARSAWNFLFKKQCSSPPPLEIEWWHPYQITTHVSSINHFPRTFILLDDPGRRNDSINSSTKMSAVILLILKRPSQSHVEGDVKHGI